MSDDSPRDQGADRDTRSVVPCCRRLPDWVPATWCCLDEGHAGSCHGVPATPIPPPDFMPRKKT